MVLSLETRINRCIYIVSVGQIVVTFVLAVVFLALLGLGSPRIDMSNVRRGENATAETTLEPAAQYQQWYAIHALIPLAVGLYHLAYLLNAGLGIVPAAISFVFTVTATDAVWEVAEKWISVAFGLYTDNASPPGGNYFEESALDITTDLTQACVAGVLGLVAVWLPLYRVRSSMMLEVRRKTWEIVLHILLWLSFGLSTFVAVIEVKLGSGGGRWNAYRGGFFASSLLDITLLNGIFLLNYGASKRRAPLWSKKDSIWGYLLTFAGDTHPAETDDDAGDDENNRIPPPPNPFDMLVLHCVGIGGSVIFRLSLVGLLVFSYPASHVASFVFILYCGYIRLVIHILNAWIPNTIKSIKEMQN